MDINIRELKTVNGQTKKGDCEVCEKTDVDITCHYGNMWFCKECWELEEQATKVNQIPANQEARVMASRNETLIAAQNVDNSIQIRTDLFNAATTSIMDLKKAIDADDSITNKPYALAEALKTRFEHYKEVVFKANEVLVDAGNNQRAIQQYLNQMANTLRAEEREKLKISDLNYTPKPVKQPTVRSVSTSQTRKSTKADKAEVAKYAKELGISEFMLQQIIVAKGVSVQQAAAIIKKSIDDAKGGK